MDNVDFVNIEQFSTKMPNKNDIIKIKYEHTKKISEESISKEIKEIRLTMDDVIFEKYSSFNMPKLPYLKCSIKNLSDNKLTVLKGLSGIICRNEKDQVVGMLMNYDRKDNCIRIVPSAIIQNFITECRSTGKYSGLSGILMKESICEFEHNGVEHIGVIVNTTYGIKYQEALNDDDVIYKIDNKEITKDGLIFDSRLDKLIPYGSYVSMNIKSNETVRLDLMRNDVKLGDYKEMVANVKPVPIRSLRNIRINHNDRYCVLNGFVFTELTENIIEFYRNHNIHIVGDVLEKYAILPYNGSKPIVLVNVMNSKFNKNDMNIISNIGLPLLKKKNMKSEFYLCVLDTINKKKISDLHDVERLISSDMNVLRFSVDKNIKLCINSSNTNLSITYIVK